MGIKVLWLDDQIKRYPEVKNIFKNNGLEIHEASSLDEAFEHISNVDFDVYVLDIMINDSTGKDGIDVAVEIKKEDPSRVVVFLSAHLHQESFRKKASTIPWEAGILEKGFGGGEKSIVSTIVTPIKKWAKKGPNQSPSDYFESISGDTNSKKPERISFALYDRLPAFVRENLAKDVASRAKDAINAEFEKGACWVLICGSIKRASHSVFAVRDIPSEEEVLAIAREKKLAYYEYTSPIYHDEVTLVSDCVGAHYTNYPTLNISFDNEELERYPIHFDTGCPVTLFNYDFLVDQSHIVPTKRFQTGRRIETNEYYTYLHTPIDLLVETQQSKSTRQATTVHAQAIKAWGRYSFSGSCSKLCQTSKFEDYNKNRLCKYREVGLVGRDIIYEGDGIRLTLDGTNNEELG